MSTVADGVVSGNEALARGEWEIARSCFERALRREVTAEALEGLGMAAWWLDDGVVVFDARERAYQLYGERSDRRGAGRVAIMLAEDSLQFRGEPAVAHGWHRRAHRLLDDLGAIPERGWLAIWEGDLALVLGEAPERVRAFANAAAAIGRDIADLDIEITALALEGLAWVVAGELTEGMARLDEAGTATMAGEMTGPVAIGLSCCYLVTACERVRDFARAAQWCRRLHEFCERTRFEFLLAVCRTQYAGVLTWRGSWAEAERELEAVVDPNATTRPALQQEARARLADLRRQQGRLDEAAELLTQIGEAHPLGMLARAGLALDRSDHAEAAGLAQRYLRQTSASNRTERVAALEVLVRADLALGKRSEASRAAEELRAIAVTVATEPFRASALIAEGLVAARDAQYARARNAFEDALGLLTRSGASLELGRCRLELGRVRAMVGERDAAEAELREALQTFERLGARGDVARTNALLRGARGASGSKAAPLAALTRREVEVLRLVARGLSNQQIAKALTVSEFTIKRHVANVLAKLELPTRAAAAAYAARAGLT